MLGYFVGFIIHILPAECQHERAHLLTASV